MKMKEAAGENQQPLCNPAEVQTKLAHAAVFDQLAADIQYLQ